MTQPWPGSMFEPEAWLCFAAIPWQILLYAVDLANAGPTSSKAAKNRIKGAAPIRQPDGKPAAALCKAEIRRHFPTREEAHCYLARHGFLLLPKGWANGRWRASIGQDSSGFSLAIALRSDSPAAAEGRGEQHYRITLKRCDITFGF